MRVVEAAVSELLARLRVVVPVEAPRVRLAMVAEVSRVRVLVSPRFRVGVMKTLSVEVGGALLDQAAGLDQVELRPM